MQRTKLAKAVEVGYGYTKFSLGINDKKLPVIHSFPSWAIKTHDNGLIERGENTSTSLKSNSLGEREENSSDYFEVKVKGKPDEEDSFYYVGKDVASFAHGKERVRTADFCLSKEYQALVAGALHYSHKEDELDMLVLALPVKRLRTFKDQLKNKYSGITLCLPDREIKVHEAAVFAQPYGGLIHWAMENGPDMINKMNTMRILVVDAGFGTLDWLVTEGFKIINSRSGGIEDAGMGSVLSRMKNAIEEYEYDSLTDGAIDSSLLDLALIDPSNAKGDLRHIDLKKYLSVGNQAINEGINRMLASGVGSIGDIDLILCIGGAAPLYGAQLQERYPRKDTKIAKSPQKANASGLHYLGMKLLQQS